jgi:hypothetical protein
MTIVQKSQVQQVRKPSLLKLDIPTSTSHNKLGGWELSTPIEIWNPIVL